MSNTALHNNKTQPIISVIDRLPMATKDLSYKDVNGYKIREDVPLTMTGVFEYSGAQVDPAFHPDEIIPVLRPKEELEDPECIKSFNLLPFTDDHPDDLLVASDDDKELHKLKGITGTSAFFDGKFIRNLVKILSKKVESKIGSGKKELSAGYRCFYEIKDGFYEGKFYRAIQRNIRADHFSLVDEGRCGTLVAVSDKKSIVDQTENSRMNPDEIKVAEKTVESEMTLEKLAEMMKALAATVAQLSEKVEAKKAAGDEEVGASASLTADEEGMGKGDEKRPENGDTKRPENTTDEDKTEEKKAAGMDKKYNQLLKRIDELEKREPLPQIMSAIDRRENLYKRVSVLTGAFDHKSMTNKQVIDYAIKTLKLDAPAGQEEGVLLGFLKAKDTALPSAHASAFDSAEEEQTLVDKYFK